MTITGEAYFALTPSCIMAGGRLDIVFQAGPIRAWFHARADFLIAWQPFHYDIDIAVRIGIAFQTEIATLTFEVGASVHLWGPRSEAWRESPWWSSPSIFPWANRNRHNPNR